jgi:hypothetical protein
MTNKIMFSNDYVGIVTVGLYNTTTDPEFSYYSTSPDIEVGILTASNLHATNLTVGVVTATGGFISSASTTPIQINYNAATTSIVFSVAGIGTTSLMLY